jgi:dolichol-phosphate mannosyltransferase
MKEKTIDLTIFIPCYNESENITRTLDNILEAASGFDFNYEILIYDDASQDNTSEVAKKYIAEHDLQDCAEVIRNEKNAGIGINYFRAAERGRGEYFIVFFGDNSEPVESMVKMFDLMGHADIIIPYIDSRFIDSRFNSDKRMFIRRFFSINFARIVRVISGHRIHYFNGFVMHRRENVLRNKIDAYGLGYQAELLCNILYEPGITFLQVRVSCADRTEGVPTAFKPRNVVSVMGSLFRIFKRRLRAEKEYRAKKAAAKEA